MPMQTTNTPERVLIELLIQDVVNCIARLIEWNNAFENCTSRSDEETILLATINLNACFDAGYGLQHKKPSPQLTDDEFKQNMRAMNE